jgi:hypothetical protein
MLNTLWEEFIIGTELVPDYFISSLGTPPFQPDNYARFD